MKHGVSLCGSGMFPKLSCGGWAKDELRRWAFCVLASLALIGFGPSTARGIGISPGSAHVTLELGNTNLVPINFWVSFWATDPQYIFWTTNRLQADDLTASNVFYSFDPIEQVIGFETPQIQGDPTNGVVVYQHRVYLSAAASTNVQTYTIDYMASACQNFTNGGGAIFIPGVIARIYVQAIPGAIASNQVVSTTEDEPVAIGLSGLWQTGRTGTFAVVSQPVHGILSGTAPNLTYTPEKNYTGPDSFMFTVNSGGADSPPATVSITVNELNTAPVLFPLPDLIAFGGQTLEYDVHATPVRGLIREVYEGVVGTTLADLTNAPHFPDDPSRIELVTNAFETVRDVSSHYGQRLRGLLIPPVSGDYFFWLQGEGSLLLHLSGDEQPEHKVAIACQMEGCWGRQSDAIRLEAGRAYYLEALMKKNPWYGDGLVVQWRRAPSQDWETIPSTNFLTGWAVFDTDIPTNALTFELLSAPEGMSVEPLDGVLTWTPPETQVPSTNWVTLKVSDSGTPSLSATQSFTVFALPTNRLPVLVVPPDQIIDEMTTLTLTNEASEAAYPELRLTFGLLNPPAGAVINLTNGVFTWTPAEDQGPSTNLIRVVVSDDGFPSVSVTQSFSVVVREVNRPPQWWMEPDVRIPEGSTLRLSLAVSNGLLCDIWTGLSGGALSDLTNHFAFPDRPTRSELLTNGFSAGGWGGDFGQRLRGWILPPETGDFVFDLGCAGCHALLFLSTDDQPTNKVLIAWSDDPAQYQSPPVPLVAGRQYYVECLMTGGAPWNNVTVGWRGPYDLMESPIASSRLLPLCAIRDPDWPANPLRYEFAAAPAGASLNPTTGELVWTPTSSQQPSTNLFSVIVNDCGTPNLCVTQNFTVVVSDVPALIVPEAVTVDEMTTLTLTMLTAQASVLPRTPTYELLSGPPNMTVDSVGGILTWTPTEAEGPSTNVVTVRVTDDGTPPRSDTQSFTVFVNEVNRSPEWVPVQNPTLVLGQTLDFSLTSLTNRGLLQEIYADIPGVEVADLTNAATFPEHPTTVSILTESFAPPGYIGDNYGQRIRGWVVPPMTGAYQFWVNSPNDVLLSLSVDDQPAHKVPFGRASAPIRLIAGRAYYFEALMKAGEGDDWLRVAWRWPDRTTEDPIPASRFVLDPQTAVGVSDPDLPPNQLSFELLSGPEGMSVEPATGRLTWTPTEGQALSTNLVTVKVTDNGWPSLCATQSFTVFVRPPNPGGPTLEPITDQVLDELTPLTLTNVAAGADSGEQLSFWLLAAPPGASVNPTNGVFSWTPGEAQGPSSNWITLMVADDGVPSLSATQSFAVVVREINSPPFWFPIPDQTVLFGDTLNSLQRGWVREKYAGIGGRWIGDLISHPAFPGQPVSTTSVPEFTGWFFENVENGYGSRIRGYVLAPVTGNLSLPGKSCNGETALYLSPDQHPEHKVLRWQADDCRSRGVGQPCEAGRLYYIEILTVSPYFWLHLNVYLPQAWSFSGTNFALAASDPDLPDNPLRYELLSGPEGATVNPVTGQVTWTPSPAQAPSTNVIRLKVSDDGAPSLSATQSFTVIVLENHPPAATLVAPTNGGVFALGQTIRLEAVASDVDGNLQAVEFFDGTNRLTEVTAPPFRFYWLTAAAGNHLLSARVRDRAGATANSEPVLITVAGRPMLTSAQPISDGRFRLSLTGQAGIEYRIEASTNLVDWVPLATNTVGELGLWEFADLEMTNYVQRFYRARQQPSIHGHVVWVDDALPAGAETGADGGDSWNWISNDPTPFSGSLAHQSSIGAGEHQHWFCSATQTLTVNTNDILFAYVYLDPNNVPSEVMLQWNVGEAGTWDHRAYWGGNYLPWGENGTASRRYVGPLPAAGQWVCLQVPASEVGLKGKIVNGMAFALYDGRATWDYVGKASP